MSNSEKWMRSAGSAGMDIRAAATNSIFPQCLWTSGVAAEALCLAPMAKIDAV
jgi:hypothetical protein